MAQTSLSRCDCCGVVADATRLEFCPNCQYPINPARETVFLEASLHNLRRVMQYGGATMSVGALAQRYEQRLRTLNARSATIAPAPKVQATSQRRTASESPFAPTLPDAGRITTEQTPRPETPSQPSIQPFPQPQPVGNARGSFFSGDTLINVIAALGGFFVLAGALGFVLTTPGVLLSFLVVTLVHGLFALAGLFTRRFPVLRTVSNLYTLIFALLIPLVGFLAYRLASNGLVTLSVPLLLALAAFYAAAIYALLAVVQRFTTFAYLSMVALLIADLTLAQALHLAYWWWPSIAMLIPFAGLLAAPRNISASPSLNGSLEILRGPLRVLTYCIVGGAGAAIPILLSISLIEDSIPSPLWELRLALFCLSALLLAWTALWIWRAQRPARMPWLAYLLAVSLLLLGYLLRLDQTGYLLLCTAMAFFYHGLTRLKTIPLTIYDLPNRTLDRIALALVLLTMLLAAAPTPFQLLTLAQVAPLTHSVPLSGTSLLLALLGLGGCVLVTLDIAWMKAGRQRIPAHGGPCWFLLLSGIALAAMYTLGILHWQLSPLWAFLVFSLALLVGGLVVRRFVSSTWAYPIEFFVLGSIGFTLLLSLGTTRDISSGLLLAFAALLYGVLFAQHRPLPALISSALLLLALPLLLVHPVVILCLGLLLPVGVATLQRVGAFGEGSFSLAGLFAWVLLLPAFLYGLALTNGDIIGGRAALADWTGLPLNVAFEIAALGLSWYAAALLTRVQLYLVPATLFWLIALVLPGNNFWIQAGLTPALAILAAAIHRRQFASWSIPFAIAALLSAIQTGYLGMTQQPLATCWFLLSFAILAYVLGRILKRLIVCWLTPLLAAWAVFLAALGLGNLYLPPVVVLVCSAFGLICSYFWLPEASSSRQIRFSLPLYATALIAAILTGIYGTFGHSTAPFPGALRGALLLYALVAFVVLRVEEQPLWGWLVAAFACWGVWLSQELRPGYLVGFGIGLALAGLLSGILVRVSSAHADGSERRAPFFASITWNWPWYIAFLLAVFVLGKWPYVAGQSSATNLVAWSMLAFTLLAVAVMLVERSPELLIFPALMAAWTLHLALASSTPAFTILAYTVLCALIFVTQYTWRLLPPATHWLLDSSLHNVLALGGLCLTLLDALILGALSANAGPLAQAGVFTLCMLSGLLFLYGLGHPANMARAFPANLSGLARAQHLKRAHSIQHYCFYLAGLLLSLAASWELWIFRQTSFDIISLVPASYLIVISPIFLRDQELPAQRVVGQFVALSGALLLFMPQLWLSFTDTSLLPALILLIEALLLLTLGLIIRLRIFILSSAALVVVGTLRILFLSIPPSVALLFMVFGGILVLLATGLILARHRLQTAWTRWE